MACPLPEVVRSDAGEAPERAEWEDDSLRHDREVQAVWLGKQAAEAHEQGDHMQAAELYLDAIPHDPESSALRVGLGREAFEAGECDIAYVALLDFFERWPSQLRWDYRGQASDEGHRLLAELEASGCVSESLLRPPACSSGTPWLLD